MFRPKVEFRSFESRYVIAFNVVLLIVRKPGPFSVCSRQNGEEVQSCAQSLAWATQSQSVTVAQSIAARAQHSWSSPSATLSDAQFQSEPQSQSESKPQSSQFNQSESLPSQSAAQSEPEPQSVAWST